MSTNDSASQDSPNAPLYVSTIDISLARDSEKMIESFQLRKNGEPLGDTVHQNIGAGEPHREEFSPPFTLGPNDCISVLVNCNDLLRKQVKIDFRLRDIECMRMEDGGRLYRKKTRNVVVVLNGYHSMFESLLATTAPILKSCPRFRLLVIGNSGVGKSSLIHRVFDVDNVHTSENARGIADINQEFISPKNDRFVVHDSLGFESGDGENIEVVKTFVAERLARPRLEDRLHAIWLCLEIPSAGGRLLKAGVEEFLQRRDEILGKIPLVVVLTKLDLLMAQLDISLPADQDLEQYKSKYLSEHCIQPLYRATGSSVAHATVSVQEGYSESLTELVKATLKHMDDYCANDAPRIVASIAQRVSIKEKIESSIMIGKKKYWRMLLETFVFRRHTLKECLNVICSDIITVWNFVDPDNCLPVMSNKIIENLLHPDNPDASADSGASTGVLCCCSLKNIYLFSKKVAKIVTVFIVDLICVMQIVFLLTSGGVSRVTLDTTNWALKVYAKTQKFVHARVSAFDGKMGSRDHVLDQDQVEALIWRYSITGQEFENLRKRMIEGTTSHPSQEMIEETISHQEVMDATLHQEVLIFSVIITYD